MITRKRKNRKRKTRKPYKRPVDIDKFRKTWLIPRLRRISRFWPEANEAMRRTRVAPGYNTCEKCLKIFHYKEIQRDHIEPMIKVSGFTDWHDVIVKLLPYSEGYQTLCKPCHAEKTAYENKQRLLTSNK